MASPEARDHRRLHLIVAAAFLLIALVQTWPLAIEPARVLPNDLGDPLLNTWILWWNAHAVPLTARWWDAPMFYPSRGTLALSEVLLGLSVFATPLQWIGASPVLAHNLLFLASFPLSAFCAYLLAWSLTRRPGPSIVAGLMYGFAVFRFAHVAHIQILWTWWMPLALLGLHRWITERRVSALILFAVAWLGQSLSNGYYFLYFSIIVALWIAWFTPRRPRERDGRGLLLPVLAAWAIAVALLAPVLWGYHELQQRYRFTRSMEEIDRLGADLTEFFRPSSLPRFMPVQHWERAEREVSLPMVGLGVLAIGLIAGARGGLRRARPVSLAVLQSVCWMLALLAAMVTLRILQVSSGRFDAPGLHLAGVSRPIAFAVPFALIAFALSPTAARAWRERSAPAFYLAAMTVAIVLAMGPFPRAFGMKIWNNSPYLWLMSFVPGFTGVRVPARFALVAVLCLAIFTALVLARLRLPDPRRERLIFGGVALLLLLETWPGPLRLVDLPPVGPVDELSRASTIVELPFGGDQELFALYRSMFHRRPIVNGYSGYFPPSHDLLQVCFERKMADCIGQLRRVIGPLDVVIDRQKDASGQWAQFVRGLPGATTGIGDERFALYRLPGQRDERLADDGSHLARVSGTALTMTASVEPGRAALAIDGDEGTAWSTGRGQEAGDAVTIAIAAGAAAAANREPAAAASREPAAGARREPAGAAASAIAGIELWPGPAYAQNFPVALRIETSEDGRRWIRAWEGATGDPRFATLLIDGLTGCRIIFPPQRGRFVRLTETVNESARAWSIAEVAVLTVP